MVVNAEFAFWVGVRLSLNLPNVRQEREKPKCCSLGSPGRKSATAEAEPGTAAGNRAKSDSCPLGENKEEAFKLTSGGRSKPLSEGQAGQDLIS